MTPHQIALTLAEINQALDDATWERQRSDELESKGALAYGGLASEDNGGWIFLVVVYEKTKAAGSATRASTGTIVFLTPELAAKARKLAQAYVAAKEPTS